MPRKAKGPRLWLDPGRKQWVIRDGKHFMRTGFGEHDAESAFLALQQYAPSMVPPKQGYVYFLTAVHPDFPIKIGFTEKLSHLRIKSLQCGCPYSVHFLGHIVGTRVDEKRLHQMFDHLRMCGEWFKSTSELRAYIQRELAKDVAALATAVGR